METKKCSKCGAAKPIEEFNRHPILTRRPDCKQCQRAVNREYAARNRQKISEAARQWEKDNSERVRESRGRRRKQLRVEALLNRPLKPCAFCNQSFRPEKSAKKIYCSPACKEGGRKRAILKHKLANTEVIRERARRYSKSPQYRENQKNLKAIRREKQREGDFTPEQWKEILERSGHRCAYCGRGDVKLTVDHIAPLSKGGKHTASNIAPCCRSCNSEKGDQDWSDRLKCP